MKKYDKNSLIGFILMAIILIVFNTFFFPEPIESNEPNIKDEIGTYPSEQPKISESNIIQSVKRDTTITKEIQEKYGVFSNASIGEETFYTIENEHIKATISSKGGKITSVIMKEYKSYDSSALNLFYND